MDLRVEEKHLMIYLTYLLNVCFYFREQYIKIFQLETLIIVFQYFSFTLQVTLCALTLIYGSTPNFISLENIHLPGVKI